jgi:membrane protein required for colicin V production
MTPVDWLIVVAVIISVLLAASNGFFYELFSFAGVVIGYLAAAWGYQSVAAWYLPMVKAPWVADIAGFLTIFIAVALLAGIIGRLARWAMKEVGLSWADRLLGAVFGLVRGVLVVAVILLATASFAPTARWLSNSQIAPYVLIVARAAVWVAPSSVRAHFHDGMKVMRDIRAAHDKPQGAGAEAKR